MVEHERFGDREHPGELLPVGQEVLRPEMAFLAENPESFGLISDACPLATKHLLIAANGHAAEGDGVSPVYDIDYHGPDGLFDFYGDLLPRTAETEMALQYAFGENNTMREQPVARYCAVLAELTAFRVLNDMDEGKDFDEALAILNDELGWALHALRERFEDMGPVAVVHEAAFQPTVGICRVRELGNGDFAADIFSAGDFRVYLLDEQGMAPLWKTVTPALAPERGVGLTGRSVRLHHPAPFAVLLVSESICSLNAAEYRILRSDPGQIWRYRMRLEDYFLRLLTDCVREYEFGDRAAHFFVGRSHGRDSASGALTIIRNGVSYETFHLQCQNRLSALGRQIELLPNGYDPRLAPVPAPRLTAEQEHLRILLEGRAGLKDQLTNALHIQILKKFEQASDAELPPPPKDAPAYERLDPTELREVLARFDGENDEDRVRIAENREILWESFAEHWITLRPALMPEEEGDPDVRAYRDVSNQIYGVCLDMNRRLAEMKARRGASVENIRGLLARSLEVALAEGEDWICGRAGQDSVSAWTAPLQEELPTLLSRLEESWAQDTERYRSLLAAYTAQRDDLFRRDVLASVGAFAERWEEIREGRLADAVWDAWRDRLTASSASDAFGEFLDALRHVSRGTGVLLARIRARAVENRAARELANRADLRIAALRGAAYEDPDWGAEVIAVMDSSARDEFRGAVRRWQEACKLAEQQKAAYESYAALYGTYTS